MPSPVLWHNLPVVSDGPRSGFGRNLYASKLPAVSERPSLQVLRWQAPFGYLVIARGTGWLWTWHAPWCRRCDCPGAGWAFSRGEGYWSGLGFELSYPTRSEP